jgi:hypothetical protein
MATAVSPTTTFPSDYDFVSPVDGVSTGKLADPVAQIVSPVSSFSNPTSTTQSGSGKSAATADRTSGELHAEAGVISGYEFPATATALFGDTLLFVNSLANAATVTTIGFNVHVDADLSDFPPGDGYTSSGNAHGGIVFTLGNVIYTGGEYSGFAPTTSNIKTTGSIVENYYGGPATIDQNYAGTFSFIGPSASASILFLLSAGGQYQYADFSNTAAFSFDTLPTGVSYTSASGDFLTPRAGSVPEPATWAMMLLGFAGLGFLGCQRAAGSGAGLNGSPAKE